MQDFNTFTVTVKYFHSADDRMQIFANLMVNLICRTCRFTMKASELFEFRSIRSEIIRLGQTKGEITVKINDRLENSVVQLLLKFPQTKVLYISCRNAYDLLAAAECLQHILITNSCLEFFARTLSVENVAEVHSIAHGREIECLIELTICYIRKRFEEYSHSEGYLNLPLPCVKEIIAEGDLKGSEDAVFQAVLRWGKNSGSCHRDMWEELLSEVRTKHVSKDCLDNALSETFIAESVIKEVINESVMRQSSVNGNQYKEPRKNCEHVLYAVCRHGLHYYVYVCDVDTGKWHYLAMTATTVEVQAVAVLNERLFLFLGRNIEIFSLDTHQREAVTTKSKIEGETIAFHEKTFYFFDYLRGNSSGRVRCLDIANLRSYDFTLRLYVYHAAAVSFGQYIYVTGGIRYGFLVNAVHQYEPSTQKLTYNISEMLIKRAYHSGISVNDMIYVCGGRSEDQTYIRSAEVFDAHTSQWTAINDMAIGREKPSLFSYKRKVFAYGGVERTVAEDGFEIYDPENREWKRCFSMPEGLKCAVLVSTVNTQCGFNQEPGVLSYFSNRGIKQEPDDLNSA